MRVRGLGQIPRRRRWSWTYDIDTVSDDWDTDENGETDIELPKVDVSSTVTTGLPCCGAR